MVTTVGSDDRCSTIVLSLSLVENRKIPTDLRDEALKLQQKTDWDDAGGEGGITL